jgi:hypothetical protein
VADSTHGTIIDFKKDRTLVCAQYLNPLTYYSERVGCVDLKQMRENKNEV